jgi:hypothetical protein
VAYAFLTKAYADFSNVSFINDTLAVADSYVEIHQGVPTSGNGAGRISAADVRLSGRIPRKMDLQFSHSVFTHMYKQPIINVLREISGLMKSDGVCVNTWLIIDDVAADGLRNKSADRQLRFEDKENGFLTDSEENPLMCTAYRLEPVRSIYEAAGHEIVDIRFGTWSGRPPTQTMTSQDVIISRPKLAPSH